VEQFRQAALSDACGQGDGIGGVVRGGRVSLQLQALRINISNSNVG